MKSPTYFIFSPSHFIGEPRFLQEKIFFVTLFLSDSTQKFGRKVKNFKNIFDNIDNHTYAHMLIKKIFKLFRFWAKFLNFLKNGQPKYFPKRSNISFWAKFSFGIGGIYSTFFWIEVLSWLGVYGNEKIGQLGQQR